MSNLMLNGMSFHKRMSIENNLFEGDTISYYNWFFISNKYKYTVRITHAFFIPFYNVIWSTPCHEREYKKTPSQHYC